MSNQKDTQNLTNIVTAVVNYKPPKIELLELKIVGLERDLARSNAKLLSVLSILAGKPIKLDWFAKEIAKRAIARGGTDCKPKHLELTPEPITVEPILIPAGSNTESKQ